MSRSILHRLLCIASFATVFASVAAAREPLPRPTGEAGVDTLAMDWGAIPEYRIVPGDLVVLDFGPQEGFPNDLIRDQRVRPDGRISVFPVGDVVAAGRTPRELEQVIVNLLSAEFRNPRVTVEIREIAGNQVHVLGRVRSPGSYDAGPFMTTMQAIAKAGGFEDDAARNSVIVFHRNGAHTVQVAKLRLDASLKEGDLSADLPLSRFDIVYVPRSTIGNINVFARQFFSEQQGVLNFMFTGWQLFNLDKVYPFRTYTVTGTATPTPAPPPTPNVEHP
ncbi:MAG TPA: polysaccharide biosynthesis/export family protein [Dongiaceae bacterium]|nr:polysaccharide biosynthesis/export family protein [Dongiaceae bacterium]